MMERDMKLNGVAALIKVVEELHEYYPRMELSQLSVLLRVLNNPGIRVTDLMQLTGLSKSATSRAVRMLGSAKYADDGTGSERTGLGLVTQVEDPFNRRASLAAPTRRGRHLGEKIDEIIRASVSEEPKA